VSIRAIRGATTVEVDSKAAIEEAVIELLNAVLVENQITEEAFISILFTATPDLKSEFPATAARKVGFKDTPLICALELDIEGALPRTIRLMAHVESGRSKAEIAHIYLRRATALRKDLNK
jgi:chorismate mutase